MSSAGFRDHEEFASALYDLGDRTLWKTRLGTRWTRVPLGQLGKWPRRCVWVEARGLFSIVEADADVIKARRRVYTLEPEWRFAFPTAVTFDAARSRLLVADTHRSRIQIYNKLQGYMEPQFNL